MTMDETKYMQTLAWATAVLTMKMMLLHLGVVRVRVSVSVVTTRLYVNICVIYHNMITCSQSMSMPFRNNTVCTLIERQVWKL